MFFTLNTVTGSQAVGVAVGSAGGSAVTFYLGAKAGTNAFSGQVDGATATDL